MIDVVLSKAFHGKRKYYSLWDKKDKYTYYFR